MCFILDRFYASEVVVALEYLHMMGIIYRDLKPENVLVRSDGHIMLTDFDLSLKNDHSTLTAQIVSNQSSGRECSIGGHPSSDYTRKSSCMIPSCMVPAVSCLQPGRRRRKRPRDGRGMEVVAEPVEVRSMSFVGTHEYLAPEIVAGEGHGNAVDWWTLGVFIFEMLYGRTPFKGVGNEMTLANIVARALEFPKEQAGVTGAAKDLMAALLVKEPSRRMGATMGAAAIKRHAFFDGVNWALLRCAAPPIVPRPFNDIVSSRDCTDACMEYY